MDSTIRHDLAVDQLATSSRETQLTGSRLVDRLGQYELATHVCR